MHVPLNRSLREIIAFLAGLIASGGSLFMGIFLTIVSYSPNGSLSNAFWACLYGLPLYLLCKSPEILLSKFSFVLAVFVWPVVLVCIVFNVVYYFLSRSSWLGVTLVIIFFLFTFLFTFTSNFIESSWLTNFPNFCRSLSSVL